MTTRFVAAIDQGTSSSRCLLFDHEGAAVASHQLEHRQHFPRPGWVEHDPVEIWDNTRECIARAVEKAGASISDIASVGITNQRETTVLWDRTSGKPVANAIVWQDTRTESRVRELTADGGTYRFQKTTGLPVSTYPSALKIAWLLDQDKATRAAAERGDVLFGTIDSWLVWNLTGGPDGGVHVTDATNASRTMLMDIATLDWDEGMLGELDIPPAMLPRIGGSSEIYGEANEPLSGAPIAGILGDQQAALFGHTCFDAGNVKNTYGTGCFMLLNTGTEPVFSEHGLITTVAAKLGSDRATYALEGSVAVAGALIRWLRDNLGIIGSSDEVEGLARSVPDNGDVVLVPAFSGLFAPHWRSDARGVVAGLTGYATKAHVARAALEAAAYQSFELAEAMLADMGPPAPAEMRVDGGMVVNDLLMQFQADIFGFPVVRPEASEVTVLGAAYAAGLAVGFWKDLDELRAKYRIDKRWEPQMDAADRERGIALWKKAVERTLDWADH
ncbi:MAG: glycerol kinase GlpK [Actinomycetota bacterium]